MTWTILTISAAANLIGLALFALDKRAAIADRRRVPERTLLALAAAGAAPAMIVLSGIIRHKTRKQPFATLLRLIALAQAAAVIAVIALALL